MTGEVSYCAGLAAEDIAERHYVGSGRPIVARRWRGSAGEVDLIAQEGQGFVFIEVKKSGSHRTAAQRLSRGQMRRIYQSASEFLADKPMGQNTEARFDVALLDGQGRLSVVENAFDF